MKPNPKYAMIANLVSEKLPTSFSQAKIDKNWREAMINEYNALLSASTWTVVPLKTSNECNRVIMGIQN